MQLICMTFFNHADIVSQASDYKGDVTEITCLL